MKLIFELGLDVFPLPFFVVQIFDNWVQPGDSFVGLFMKAEPGRPRGDSMFFSFLA